MNEYAMLAKQKPPEARNDAELFAACFGFDADRAQLAAMTYQDGGKLPGQSVNARALAEMLRELDARRPGDIVRDGRPVIRSMADITGHAMDIRDKKKEYLLAFFLNARHQLIARETISIGTLTASLAHPREIFAPAIGKAAAGVVLVHNHPSGDPSPSDEDVRLTQRIRQSGVILGIELMDHLIVAENGTYSFKTAGRL